MIRSGPCAWDARPLCQGNRSGWPMACVPDAALRPVLETYPWLGHDANKRPDRVRLVTEDPDGPEVRP